tara:strand:- start:4254 stop:4496 length:243 start_codon:yes stop_codon:yes gene_type:complete
MKIKKTQFLKTKSGIVVVPRLENSSWLGRWAYDRWLRKHFKAKVQKAAPRSWEIMSEMFEIKTLVEENGVYREESREFKV